MTPHESTIRSEGAATALRGLPSVDSLLQHASISPLLDEFPRPELLAAVRDALDRQRQRILAGHADPPDIRDLAMNVRESLHRRAQPRLRRVINATGVVLHTGLGRAPLPAEALEALTDVAAGYCNLELDLETGQRGDRHEHVRGLLCELTGAPDALVVNNNAAATFLALHALAAGREVIVSRGQLVEIGGSYRMPDVMAAAGCRMVEVGTTNRTRLDDYRAALTPATALLVRVHTSNYRIVGFTESPSLAELVDLAQRQGGGVEVVDDLGSGLLTALDPGGVAAASDAPPRFRVACDGSDAAELPAGTAPPPDAPPAWDEPSVADSVAAGAGLSLFSGDKLLGGPQAGIIVGRPDLIARLRTAPMMRALRPDKLTLAALEATLRLYRDPASVCRRVPVLRMLMEPASAIRARAERLAGELKAVVADANIDVHRDVSLAGGGSLPAVRFDTCVVSLRHPSLPCDEIAAALRRLDTPVIVRVHDGAVIFDCRTLSPDDDAPVASAVADVVRDTLGT
ncbi:MAG: L-seryl-tRNA(Sec) selenium transferase [Phycisphaerae bacterium]|nr:L-seryl-tRNA(Sec) selenium transferase [Phycisphaerae bacterium]